MEVLMQHTLEYYLVGQSPAMLKFKGELKTVAPTMSPLLFWGEPGSGMTFYAKAVHATTQTGKFIPISCFSLEPASVKRQFLGFEDTAGWLEEAHEGTIFLKRITECSLAVQEILARIIVTENVDGIIDFIRVNSTDTLQSKVRFMASLVGDLDKALTDKILHPDLFEVFKNHGKILYVPSLRERREDIPEIIALLLQELNNKYHKKLRKVSREAIELLQSHPWRGNIDELKRTLDALFAQPDIEEGVITAEQISPYLSTPEGPDRECLIKLKAEQFKGRLKSQSFILQRDSDQYTLPVEDIMEIIRVDDEEFLTPKLKYFTFKLKDGSQINGKILDEFIEVETSFTHSFRFTPAELQHLVIS
jgi:DNA-binding NtrC family response regulator